MKKRFLLVFVILLPLILAAAATISATCNGIPNTVLFSGIVGAGLGSTITVVLLLIAYGQLNIVSSNSSTELIHKLKIDLFSVRTRRLFSLIESDFLSFVNEGDRDSYFLVKTDEVMQSKLHERIKKELVSRPVYSCYDLDDLILGPFEDLGYLNQQGMINFYLLHNTFAYYINQTRSNKAITEYIQLTRSSYPQVYQGLDYIHNKCCSYNRIQECLCPFGRLWWWFRYEILNCKPPRS